MSKPRRDYLLFLEDIANAIHNIQEYTAGMSYEDFKNNHMAIDAVIRNFEIIGEAANNSPHFMRHKYPDIEWIEAIGFRNVLIHDYFGIDVEAVWDTILNNIPSLQKAVLEAIEHEKAPGESGEY
jgi:uncharacterized protein with HEPN domain